MGIQIVEIPAQTAENVLTRFKQNVEFTSTFLVDPVDVSFHIPLRVSRADDRDLGLEELRERFLPFVRAGWVSQTRVEEHEAVQIGIKRLEVLRFVHRVEVVNVRRNLELSSKSVLHDTTEGILGRALGQREFIIPVGHTLRSDEDQMDQGAREYVAKLKPNFTRQRGLSASPQNKYAHWRSLKS